MTGVQTCALPICRIQTTSPVSAVMESNFALFKTTDPVLKLSQAMSEGKTTIVVSAAGEVQAIVAKIDLIGYLGRKRR